jgi:type III secretion system needle length determinant
MSGVERNTPSGGAQPNRTGEADGGSAKLADISEADAKKFSSTLAKGKAAEDRSGLAGKAGDLSTMPRPHPAARSNQQGGAQPKTETGQAQASDKIANNSENKLQPNPARADQPSQSADKGDARGVDGMQTLNAPHPQSQGLTQSAAPGAPSSPSISDLAEKLADRILVSKPETGKSEVRIELNIDKLQGASITLRQDANGLKVVFDSPSPEVTNRLMETRGELVQRLQAATGETVSVDVKERHSGQDQPGDGRSRNRRDLDGEEDENA